MNPNDAAKFEDAIKELDKAVHSPIYSLDWRDEARVRLAMIRMKVLAAQRILCEACNE